MPQTRVLAELARALVVAPELFASHRSPHAPADLATWPFIHRLVSRPPVLELRCGGGDVVLAIVSAC